MAKNMDINTSNPALMNKDVLNDPLVRKSLELQIARMEREEEILKEEKEKEHVRKLKELAAQKRDADEQERRRVAQEAAQANCPHSSKGVSFVRGQRDGNGGYILFCQFCQKTYDSPHKVPQHLQVEQNLIGGPNY